MKNLDLRKLPTKLINLDKDKERLKLVTAELDKVGITFDRFSAIPHKRGIVGCGQSHLAVLSEISPGTLVFEDDVVVVPPFNPVLEVPEDADAIYLGVSMWGYYPMSPHSALPRVSAEKYSPEFIKVNNMCSAHAIVYLSQEFIDSAKEIAKKSLEDNIPWDLGLASIHKHFTILTPNTPQFYQRDLVSDTALAFIV